MRTFEERLLAYALRAASTADVDDPSRAAGLLLARFGGKPGGRTLSEVGKEFGLTKQRVQAAIRRLITVCPPSKAEAMEIAALDARIRAHLPVPAQAADRHFRRELGKHPTVADVMRFAHEALGAPRPVPLKPLLMSWGGHWVALDSTEPWARDACRIVGEFTRNYGGTLLEIVAGRLSFERGVAVRRVDLVQALQQHPKFTWLDEIRGWCAIDGSKGLSQLEERLRKILAAADDQVTLDDFIESIALEPPRSDRGGFSLLLPYPAMLARVRKYAWLDVDHHNRIRAKRPLVPSEVLSGSELAIVKQIRAAGGIATTQELVQAVKRTGVSDEAGKQAIRLTPILRQVGRGRYTVRGWRAGRVSGR
jgi:hypothetical protein